MHRRTVHRRVAALALVTALALVGARPAAAMELGFLDRLGSLWSAVAPDGFWETLTGWFGGSGKPASPDGVMKTVDQTQGFDPNGQPVASSTTQPADGSD